MSGQDFKERKEELHSSTLAWLRLMAGKKGIDTAGQTREGLIKEILASEYPGHMAILHKKDQAFAQRDRELSPMSVTRLLEIMDDLGIGPVKGGRLGMINAILAAEFPLASGARGDHPPRSARDAREFDLNNMSEGIVRNIAANHGLRVDKELRQLVQDVLDLEFEVPLGGSVPYGERRAELYKMSRPDLLEAYGAEGDAGLSTNTLIRAILAKEYRAGTAEITSWLIDVKRMLGLPWHASVPEVSDAISELKNRVKLAPSQIAYATESARTIMEVLVPAWAQRFLAKNADYGDQHRMGLGPAAEYVGVDRKMAKLEAALWHEQELNGEGVDEMLDDMIGQLFLIKDLRAGNWKPSSRVLRRRGADDAEQ